MLHSLTEGQDGTCCKKLEVFFIANEQFSPNTLLVSSATHICFSDLNPGFVAFSSHVDHSV